MARQYKDQSDIRLQNTLGLLDIMRHARPISRADIAKTSNMSPASITRIVADLQEIGLIRETEQSVGGIGRRAVMLDIVPEGLYTIGVHIDQHQLHLCLLDFGTNLVALTSVDCDCLDRSVEEIVHICLELFHGIAMKHHIGLERVIGIGIGVVGIIEPTTSEVVLSPQLGWHDTAIKPCFERVFGIKAVIDNNVKASLIGEKELMNIPPDVDTAMLLLGSGVGCATTSKGVVLRGRQNAAGEVGHIIIDRKDGIDCECGRRGCLQTHIAIGYLLSSAQQHDSSIRSMSDLRTAFDAGKSWAAEIISDCKDHIRLALEIINEMYNPTKTIITGVLLNNFRDEVFDAVKQYKKTALVPQIADNLVMLSDADNKSCVLGSAYMARNEFLGGYIANQLLTNRQRTDKVEGL